VIPALLWRCPLCAAQDALVQRRLFLRPDRLDCPHCAARWRVRRLPGDDFYLRLDRPSVRHPMPAGEERPLAAWYDMMKTGLRLDAITHPKIPLQPGEDLYLASRSAELWIAADDPMAADRPIGRDAPARDLYGLPVKTRLASDLSSENPVLLAGIGQVFLTSRRLAWQSESCRQDFPLDLLQGGYAIVNLGLAVVSGMRLVFFRFQHESPLKWVSYLSLAAVQVQAETGRPIVTSHW